MFVPCKRKLYTFHKSMQKVNINKRILKIRASLKYGDITKIAKKAGVTREWVSYVLLGQGVSEKILKIAEEHIRLPKPRKNISKELKQN